ncbi:MAG: carboxypeptidase-like regulatory domain-containing protein [Chitinophagaceae bacterium]|nr:carboxypeptidase-like regulatory domain-containing protein [Chitinophagaceae bacterium]
MFTQQLKKVTGLLLLVLITQVSLAQNKVITGKVTDARDGTPLQGVTVAAKGNRTGTQTDAKGAFQSFSR